MQSEQQDDEAVLAVYHTAPNVTVYIMDTYLRDVPEAEQKRRKERLEEFLGRLGDQCLPDRA